MALISVPERGQVWLIPDVDDDVAGHSIRLHIGYDLIQVLIPELPFAGVTWVGSATILRAVGAPQIVDQEYELSAMTHSCLVIAQCRREPILEKDLSHP